MRYKEFSVVAEHGEHIRIRETLPDALDRSPIYTAVSESGQPLAHVLPDGTYCVNGKAYYRVGGRSEGEE